MSKQNDIVIKELLKKVEDKKADLGTKERASWRTNGIFKYVSGQGFFNLNTVTDATILIQALASLVVNEQCCNEAAKRLDLPIHEYRWDGYSIKDWEEDFKTRIRTLEYDKKKKSLDATKQKLSSLVSEEAKTEMELEDIKKLLDS